MSHPHTPLTHTPLSQLGITMSTLTHTPAATVTVAPAPHGAPTIDWDAVLALPDAAREAALVKITGVRPDADRYGHVTGADARRERAYNFNEPTTATALDAHVHAHGDPVVSTVRDAVRESAHVLPDTPDAVRMALVLSALMHDDVLTREGRPVVTRIAAQLYGRTELQFGERNEVKYILDLAIGHLANDILDHLDGQDVDADVRTLTHRLLATHDGRVVATMDEHTVYVVAHPGSDERGQSGWTTPATRVEARERRQAGRVYGPYAARVQAPAPAPLPVHTVGARFAHAEARGTATPPRDLPLWMRYARAMTRGTTSGQGYGTDEHGNRTRDALRRVDLRDGFTFSRERLATPLTGGSWVEGKPSTPARRKAADPVKAARKAEMVRATAARTALLSRLAR